MRVESWQLVLVCWGTKYGVADINRSHNAARRNSARHARTVLITDRERPGLDADIVTVEFPDTFTDEAFRGPGCQAKLSMFSDIVPDDMPAVFTDLDSLILGDLAGVFIACQVDLRRDLLLNKLCCSNQDRNRRHCRGVVAVGCL